VGPFPDIKWVPSLKLGGSVPWNR